MANRNRDPHKEQFWREQIDAWKQSGLSVRDFCRQHKLAEPNFYHWRAVLAQRDQLDSDPTLDTTEDADLDSAKPLPLFLPLTVQAQHQPVEVVLPDGTRLLVPASFDAHSLRRLLALLREVPC